MPTYTLPTHTVGMLNRSAIPARSRAAFCSLFHSSTATLAASNPRTIAGRSSLPKGFDWMSQTMPSRVPCAEIVGVAPGLGIFCFDSATGVSPRRPFWSA